MAIALLLLVTAVWGWTFVVVRDAIRSTSVMWFLSFRFVLATALLFPFTFRRFSLREVLVGGAIGVSLAAGYAFQTVGLKTATAADAGLLTGLFVILTPILGWLIYRVTVRSVTMLAVIVGFAGTALLTAGSGHGWVAGDVLEVLTAVAFAVQIVLLGRHAPRHSASNLAFGQLLCAAIVFTLIAPSQGAPGPGFRDSSVVAAILITGGLASAGAFWVQTWAQQHIAPERTAVILLAEPAFATGFAVLIGGESLSLIGWVGAVLILATLCLHELAQSRRTASDPDESSRIVC